MSVNLEPLRTTEVLSQLSLKKIEVNQDLISCKQAQREEGGKVEGGKGGIEFWLPTLIW